MDLFATCQNRKCHLFCLFQGINRDSLSDAFLLLWSGALMYAFPLVLHKVLIKVKQDKTKVILIAPAWRHQYWFSTLMDVLV